MNVSDVAFLSITELARALRAGETDPVTLATACLERIAALDPTLNSFITVTGDAALAEAEAAGAELASGADRGPLHGIPLAVKDLFATEGVRTTFACAAYADWVPDHDAAAVERLRSAGAVIVGKTNLHEIAGGSSNVTSHFGAARNPWNPEYITGGSSGGSAAAVAAGMVPGALGSDTAMSVRYPAALCGVVGLKPTYGRVSKFGALPLSYSLDHVGPMTRTVRDAALMLGVLAGHDIRDPTTVDRPVPDYGADLERGVEGVRLGVPRPELFRGVDPALAAPVEAALEVLAGLGARLEPVKIPHLDDLIAVGSLIIAVEAAAYHEARLRDRPDALTPDLARLLETGRLYGGARYAQARRVRRTATAAAAEAIAGVDALVLPTTPLGAIPIAEDKDGFTGPRFRNTLPFNVTGHPAVSVPCGFTPGGLPAGLQLVGQPFGEADLLRIARAYEHATDWLDRRPPL